MTDPEKITLFPMISSPRTSWLGPCLVAKKAWKPALMQYFRSRVFSLSYRRSVTSLIVFVSHVSEYALPLETHRS